MDQSLFSAPHGLSQSITSFIASCCQGIHQTPFSRLIRSSERQTYLPGPGRFARGFVSTGSEASLSLPRQKRGVVVRSCDRTWLVYLTWTTLSGSDHWSGCTATPVHRTVLLISLFTMSMRCACAQCGSSDWMIQPSTEGSMIKSDCPETHGQPPRPAACLVEPRRIELLTS